MEVSKEVRLQELRVKICDTVDLVRTDNTEIGHTDFLRNAFLDQRKNVHFVGITWILLTNSGQPEVVDQINEFQMSGQQSLQEFDAPFLKSFRQNCVISVRKSVINDVPGSFLIQMFLIDHDSQQFDNTESWMGIIELNGDFIGEIFPLKLTLVFFAMDFMTTDDILNCGRYEKILLLETKLLSLLG